MMMAITTSIRMPDDVYEQYETLAQATGRTRNELMVEALRGMAERQLREIAMIQEGLVQSHAGLGSPIEDVVAQLKAEGLLPADFVLGADVRQAGA
jgi:predicted transcriptional regulator